jgi:hypothetical protein
MSSLGQQIAAKKEAEEAASCYARASRTGSASFVEFRPDPHTRVGFPMGQLCHYTLEPNSGDQAAPERLSLGFSTADVVIVGARLGKLVELLGSHDLAALSVLDTRYAGTLGREPWVGKIAITWINKSADVSA